MAHVGEVGKKITSEVVYKRFIKVYNPFCSPYNYTDTFIYFFEDENGNVLTWKTNALLSLDEVDQNGTCKPIAVNVGAKLILTGTVKAHTDYKGVDQTNLSRCKYKLVENGLTAEERRAQKQMKQLKSLEEGDFIWSKMPYKQYKEHYSDCETVADSYDAEIGTIDVIIRNGRLKNSGVRGMIYMNYTFKFANGRMRTYKAVNEHNALMQLKKDFPDEYEEADLYNCRPYSEYKLWL